MFKDEGLQGCKVEGSKFISVDTIWSILETHLFKLIRVNALCDFGSKIGQNVCHNESKIVHGNVKMKPLEVKMLQMEPSGP